MRARCGIVTRAAAVTATHESRRFMFATLLGTFPFEEIDDKVDLTFETITFTLALPY